MISARSSDQDIKQQAIKEGMKTLFESAANQVFDGIATVEELTRIIDVEEE